MAPNRQIKDLPKFASKLASPEPRTSPKLGQPSPLLAHRSSTSRVSRPAVTRWPRHRDRRAPRSPSSYGTTSASPKTFEVTIGTGSDMEDPMAQAVRTIQTMWSAVGTIFGSNDLF